MTEPKYGVHNYKCRDVLSEVITLLGDDLDETYCVPDAVTLILSSDKETAVFWLSFIKSSVYTMAYENPGRSKEDERVAQFKTVFSFELIRWVIVHSDAYIRSDIENFFELAYPRLSLLRAVGVVSWQAYMERMKAHLQLRIFDNLNNPPQPFQDERFSVIPVHTDRYQKGEANSPWLKDVEGHYQYLWDKENQCRKLEKLDDASSHFYIDAKIGLLFLFEGRPSIVVSFNVDKNGGVFIHQVQAKIKDRGHYKLGQNWRTRVTDYIKSMFSGSRVYLIDGKQAANDAYRAYGEQAPEGIKPTPLELSRIAQTYSEWVGLSVRRRRKSGKFFRKIA